MNKTTQPKRHGLIGLLRKAGHGYYDLLHVDSVVEKLLMPGEPKHGLKNPITDANKYRFGLMVMHRTGGRRYSTSVIRVYYCSIFHVNDRPGADKPLS